MKNLWKIILRRIARPLEAELDAIIVRNVRDAELAAVLTAEVRKVLGL